MKTPILGIVKRHTISLFVYIIATILIAIIFTFSAFNTHVGYINKQQTQNIYEYDELDKEQLCRVAECTYVIDNKFKLYKMNNNILKTYTNKINFDVFKFSNIYIIDYKDEYHFATFEPQSKSYYILDTTNFTSQALILAEVIIPLMILTYMSALMISLRKEKNMIMTSMAGEEALLQNKSMILITENIHHELNTPLEVLDNSIEKIHNKVLEYLEDRSSNRQIDQDLINLNEDFLQIKASSQLIYSVLEKMKGFKHLRYSNGNKSLYDIVKGAFRMVRVSTQDFMCFIDDKLKDYKLCGTLKNEDLLSILINHIKNSIEANATAVHIILDRTTSDKVFIRILDDGNGIPKHAIENIFKPNFSTKRGINTTRGNGMYLNKHVLENSGGSVKVVETSNIGTTIELSIKSKKV